MFWVASKEFRAARRSHEVAEGYDGGLVVEHTEREAVASRSHEDGSPSCSTGPPVGLDIRSRQTKNRMKWAQGDSLEGVEELVGSKVSFCCQLICGRLDMSCRPVKFKLW